MYVAEWLSLATGVLCTAGPFAQAVKTVTTRNVSGLSAASYMLMVPLGLLAVLIGVQYRIYALIFVNGAICLCNAMILSLISWRIFISLVAAILAAIGIAALSVPWALEGIVTTRWAEQTAFIQGLWGACTFFPQVLLTHRTRAVSALSLVNLALFTTGMVFAVMLAIVLRNWAMLFWNSIILLFMGDLLRLKVTIEYRAKREVASLPDRTTA